VKSHNTLDEVNLEALKRSGKKLIMLDVDHTLVHWKQEDYSPGVLDWIDRAKTMGFMLVILSNTHRPARLARISERLKIKAYRGKFKPCTDMYLQAMKDHGTNPAEAIMIGDQMMTDVLGANRAGIEAIWLKKLDGPEFFGTKFNRVIEFIISGLLAKARC
jgi:hypothetical protein